MYTYQHPRPAVTVDIAIFKPKEDQFQILLIQRDREPFQGDYALPGGFLDQNETLEAAAERELKEETGLTGILLTQVRTFSAPDRDPRGRVISTCFGAVLEFDDKQQAVAGDDARSAGWFDLDNLPPLAFDHGLIVQAAAQKLLPGW